MSQNLQCALLSALVAQHRYGQPIPQSALLRTASFPSHRGGDAKEAFDDLREKPFIVDQRNRGIMLNSSEFGELAQYLHQECGVSEFELKIRLKHFEGWDDIEFE